MEESWSLQPSDESPEAGQALFKNLPVCFFDYIPTDNRGGYWGRREQTRKQAGCRLGGGRRQLQQGHLLPVIHGPSSCAWACCNQCCHLFIDCAFTNRPVHIVSHRRNKNRFPCLGYGNRGSERVGDVLKDPVRRKQSGHHCEGDVALHR